MGLGDTLGPLPVANGGTGKTDLTGIMSVVYPVGSIYISVNSTNPSTLFGGTWQEIQGKFLLGRDSSHKAGSTGGEFNHTLTVNEMPSHSHTKTCGSEIAPYESNTIATGSTVHGSRVYSTDSVGGGKSHNNTPPYLAVYIWKRVS